MAVANPQMRQGEVRAVNKQPKRGRSDKGHVVCLISPVIGAARPIALNRLTYIALLSLHSCTMFRQSIRRFGTTALRAAEGSTAYCTRVSTAQGAVNGLTEGMSELRYNCITN